MDELNIEILLNNVDISILKNADGICSLRLSNAFQSTLGKLCGVSVTSRFIIIRTESNTDADNSINVHRAITVCNMDDKSVWSIEDAIEKSVDLTDGFLCMDKHKQLFPDIEFHADHDYYICFDWIGLRYLIDLNDKRVLRIDFTK